MALGLLAVAVLLPAQRIRLIPAPALRLPTHIDGNSPAFWDQHELKLFTSTGAPQMISEAARLRGKWTSQDVDTSGHLNKPLWTEAAWRDADGTVLGWYHHEPGGVCGAGSGLTAPKIGAVVSYDGGPACAISALFWSRNGRRTATRRTVFSRGDMATSPWY